MVEDSDSVALRLRPNRVQPDAAGSQRSKKPHRLDKKKEKPGFWAGLQSLLDAWDDDDRQMQEDILKELDDADEEARKSFKANLEAKEKAKGSLDDEDFDEALNDLRKFQEAANRRLGPVRMFLRRQAGDFKAFISRGNVIDLAVGTVVGTAFTGIVKGFTAAFITPAMALIQGTEEISTLAFMINGVEFPYGTFLAAVIDFFIASFILYFVVLKPFNYLMKCWDNLDVINKMHGQKQKKKVEAKKVEAEKKNTKPCPYCLSEIPLLATKCKFCTSDQPPGLSAKQQ